MPRVKRKDDVRNFSYGELSQRLLGQELTNLYKGSVEQMLNWKPYPQGGTSYRTGFKYITNVGPGQRLIPYSPQDGKNLLVCISSDSIIAVDGKEAFTVLSSVNSVVPENPLTITRIDYQWQNYFDGESDGGREGRFYRDLEITLTFNKSHSFEVGDLLVDFPEPISNEFLSEFNGHNPTSGIPNYFPETIQVNECPIDSIPASNKVSMVIIHNQRLCPATSGTQFYPIHHVSSGEAASGGLDLDTPFAGSIGISEINFTAAEVKELDYVQVNNQLVLVHPNHIPVVLTYISDKSYNLAEMVLGDYTNEENDNIYKWTGAGKYPSKCAYYQKRLYLSSNDSYPDRIWASKIGSIHDFALYDGDEVLEADNAAFSFDIDFGDGLKKIESMTSLERGVAIGTLRNFSLLTGGSYGSPVTARSISVRDSDSYGTSEADFVVKGRSVFYITSDRKKIRGSVYSNVEGNFFPDEVSLQAEHIVKRGIKKGVYVRGNPDYVYFLRDDGTLVLMLQDVVNSISMTGWSRLDTAGEILDIESVQSSDDYDNLYIYARLPNGSCVISVFN